MNYKILKKILDELNKENFRKDYVIGMLETLLESAPEENKITFSAPNTFIVKDQPLKNGDIIRDEEVKAKLEAVKKLTKYDN